MSSIVKKPIRAGKFRTVLITLGSWASTLYYSLKAIVTVVSAKNPRLPIDRVVRQWSQSLVNRVGMKIKVIGEFKHPHGRPCIVMCSHSSAYDIPVSFLAIPGSLRMLAKQELFRIPLFGRAMRMSEFVSIHRQNKEQAKKDLELAKQKMIDGIVLWIAPEGTRSTDGKLLPFKKGGMHLAIQTGALVIPVVIKDIHKVMPTKTYQINLNQKVEVRIGEPIDATEFTFETRNQLAKMVRESMEKLLDSPLTGE